MIQDCYCGLHMHIFELLIFELYLFSFYRTVHLCRRLADKKLIIIKQIPVEQMTKEERQAALNEVKVLSMLCHPNIIQYYENFLEDKALMIVMEYAQGNYIIYLCNVCLVVNLIHLYR